MKDWREQILDRVRALLKQVDPEIDEQLKWRGVPTFYSSGKIVCTGETYKDKVKLTFLKGASLEDPAKLFNSSLEGNARRAIDIRESDKVDERVLKALFKAACALNAG